MFTLEADITRREVAAPSGRRCNSGHVPPELFARDGQGTEKRSTRFYELASKQNPSVNGIYCEICLIVATYVGSQRRKRAKELGVPVESLASSVGGVGGEVVDITEILRNRRKRGVP